MDFELVRDPETQIFRIGPRMATGKTATLQIIEIWLGNVRGSTRQDPIVGVGYLRSPLQTMARDIQKDIIRVSSELVRLQEENDRPDDEKLTSLDLVDIQIDGRDVKAKVKASFKDGTSSTLEQVVA